MVPFTQQLPDLADYRRELIRTGAPSPLPRVPFRPTGLLGELPSPPPGRHGWPWDIETTPNPQASDCPLVSIVIPSYQQGDYLEEAIRSVLLQNYPRLEFIVMDGGSTDRSAAIVEKYRPWLSCARRDPDRGQSHAINLGFSLATGDLRGWLNSDDFYLPDALFHVAATARHGADFIYGDSLELEQSTAVIRHIVAGYVHARYTSFSGLIPSHGAFWAKACHQPVWEEQQCAMDYELWTRLLPGTRIRHIGRPLGVLRVHPHAKSTDVSHAHYWKEDAQRNGLAHPHLYGPRTWLRREFRIVQRIVRWRRLRGEEDRLRRLQAQCGWSTPIRHSL